MSAWNIAFLIVWNLCERLQYELVQIEWTVICRITTQKIFSEVVALYYIFIVNSLFVSFVFPIQDM